MSTMERKISNLAIRLVKEQSEDKKGEYRAFCEGFPNLLRMAGLAQCVTFLRAKGGHPHGTLYGHLEQQFQELGLLAADHKSGLLELVTSANKGPAEYRLYSQIANRAAHWHKRLSQALIQKDKSKEKGNERAAK